MRLVARIGTLTLAVIFYAAAAFLAIYVIASWVGAVSRDTWIVAGIMLVLVIAAARALQVGSRRFRKARAE